MTAQRLNSPNVRRAVRILICQLVVGSAAVANASGTVTPGSSQAASYQLGKSVFHRKLVCSGCTFEGRGKSAEDARKLIVELDSTSALNERERAAVVLYLTKLHRLG